MFWGSSLLKFLLIWWANNNFNSALLVRFMTKRFISEYSSFGKIFYAIHIIYMWHTICDISCHKNGNFLDDFVSPQTFYSEMRYNHFTYVDREIAYFDLLDMSYQVFYIIPNDLRFSHPSHFLSSKSGLSRAVWTFDMIGQYRVG